MITCDLMRNKIEQLAKKHNVDLYAGEFILSIKHPPFQPLVIESAGPRCIAVTHYIMSGGPFPELLCDPTMEFVWFDGISASGKDRKFWFPSYLRMVNGRDWTAGTTEGGEIKTYNPALAAQLKSFASMWARNIKGQGFIDRGVRVKRGAKAHIPEILPGEEWE